MELRSIAGHELTPGKTVKDHIHVEGTELHVPHVLLCGQRPGPTVLISAGIHNAEYVGLQAAIELSNELDVSALRGNVIIVPLANRSGFENRTMSRVFEDGKNLNRVFPGDREGSEADRLAHMLFEVFIRNVDAYIDLHSGDGYETLMPFAYYLGDTAAKADLFIEIKPGTDAALALGMCKRILDTGKQDTAWMEANSIGYQDFIDYVNNDITLEWAAEKTGLSVADIENLADEYAAADPACIFIGFGMQRHTNGGASVRAIDALAALTGNIGKVGGGANYGQLDSWGFNYACMGYSNEDNADADRSININNFAAEVLNADPKIEMLWIACRNPMSQDAETAVEIEAFKSIDFIVTVDQFMNPSVEWSDLVLPCCTIFETWGLHASYLHYWMNGNQPAIDEMYEFKTDVEIGMGVSKRLNELQPGSCTYPTDKPMKEWCAAEMSDAFKEKFGFKDWEEIFEKGTAKVEGYDAAWADGNFRTPSGKYEFYSEKAASFGNHLLPVYVEEYQAPAEYPVRLLNPHWKYGLHSQFQNLDWMRDIHDEPFAELSKALADEKGVADGDMINIFNDIGSIHVRAKVTDTAPKGAIVVYEAWYKDAKFNVNYLVKAIPADMGDCATGQPGIPYHDCFVDFKKV